MTGPRYLLDTNIFIYIRRRHPSHVRRRLDEIGFGEAAMSVINHGELLFGAERSETPERSFTQIEELTAAIPVLPLPVEAASLYGKIRAALSAKGEIISTNDLWIAAHAMVLDLTLVTNNEREFKRIAGLKIENWVR